MDNLGKEIGRQLYQHDCVIVPDFGGFVGNEVGARLNERQKTITPPSKFISFNKNLTHNDGLLANAIARREGCSYDMALSRIRAKVEEYQKQLESGRRIELDTVGVLYKSKDGRLHFIADERMNFLTSAFGFSAVSLPQHSIATNPSTGDTKVVAIVEEKQEIQAEETPKKKKRRWIAAAAVFLPIAALAGYVVLKGLPDVGDFQLASLNPFSKVESNSAYQPRFEEEAIIFNYPEDQNSVEVLANENPEMGTAYFSFREDKTSPEGILIRLSNNGSQMEMGNNFEENDPPAIVEEVEPSPKIPSSNPSESVDASTMQLYFVVGGAFREKSNAENMVAGLQSKGYDASIFGKNNGLHMVCYGSYTNKKAAKEALSSIKASENKNAWLKKS